MRNSITAISIAYLSFCLGVNFGWVALGSASAWASKRPIEHKKRIVLVSTQDRASYLIVAKPDVSMDGDGHPRLRLKCLLEQRGANTDKNTRDFLVVLGDSDPEKVQLAREWLSRDDDFELETSIKSTGHELNVEAQTYSVKILAELTTVVRPGEPRMNMDKYVDSLYRKEQSLLTQSTEIQVPVEARRSLHRVSDVASAPGVPR